MIEELLDAKHLTSSQIRVVLKPLMDLLFRTEEVVDPSTPTEKNQRRRWCKFPDSPLLDHNSDGLSAQV